MARRTANCFKCIECIKARQSAVFQCTLSFLQKWVVGARQFTPVAHWSGFKLADLNDLRMSRCDLIKGLETPFVSHTRFVSARDKSVSKL